MSSPSGFEVLPPAGGNITEAAQREPMFLREAQGTIQEAEQQAKVRAINAETWTRAVMVVAMTGIFIGLNYYVMTFVGRVFEADIELIRASPSASRVVTTEVLASLIAATAAQVGIGMFTIVSYLFPKSRPDKTE